MAERERLPDRRGCECVVLTLKPLPGIDAIRALRALLRRALRSHGLKCIGLSVPNTISARERSVPMDNTELEFLRRYASGARSRGGFGVSFLKCDGNSGQWKAGKDSADMDGRQLVADVPDAMHGFQKFENRKPIYVIGRICDGYQPPERGTLGDTNSDRWHNGRDPWTPIVLLPMFDLESREPFIFTSASDGGKDAVAALVDAVIDNVAHHPDDADKLPICTLGSDSYLNSHGKEIYTPIFEIMGWSERPAAVRRIRPPPIDMLAIENKSRESESVQAESPAKPKRQRFTVTSSGDVDDEIPF